MKKNRKKQQIIHTNVLTRNPFAIDFCQQLHIRFVDLCNLWLTDRKEELVPPNDLDADMLRWRTLVARVRHQETLGVDPYEVHSTKDEQNSMKRIAEWTYKKKCELTGQKHEPLNI